jgi:hypothetical protein
LLKRKNPRVNEDSFNARDSDRKVKAYLVYQLPLAPPPNESPPPKPLELLPDNSDLIRDNNSTPAAAKKTQPQPVLPDLMQEIPAKTHIIIRIPISKLYL